MLHSLSIRLSRSGSPRSALFCSKYLFLLWLCFFASNAAQAAQVTNLYTASVPVASLDLMSAGDAERNSAFASALEQVLLKVAGSRGALREAGVLSKLRQAQTMVLSFSYRDNPRYRPEKAGIVQPYLFDVVFAKPAIDKFLSRNQVAVWGSTRPAILLWVVRDKGGSRQLLGEANSVRTLPGLRNLARARALPIYLPVADLTDMNQIDMAELWGQYSGATSAAAQRYRPDVEVLVKMRQGSSRSTIDWSFQLNGKRFEGSQRSVLGANLFAPMVEQIGQVLAARYALQTSNQVAGQEAELIQISGLNSFDDYAALQRYLNSIPYIKHYTLEAMIGPEVRLALELTGDLQQLLDYFSLASKLKPSARSVAPSAQAQITEAASAAPIKAYFNWRAQASGAPK